MARFTTCVKSLEHWETDYKIQVQKRERERENELQASRTCTSSESLLKEFKGHTDADMFALTSSGSSYVSRGVGQRGGDGERGWGSGEEEEEERRGNCWREEGESLESIR